MGASHDAPYATDLRRLSTEDEAVLRAVTRQRHGAYYSDVNPLEAYDAIVHIPHVTAADLDPGAVAESHEDIRKVLG
jgi:erythromycin esterase